MCKYFTCFLFVVPGLLAKAQNTGFKKSTVTVGIGGSIVSVLGKVLENKIDKAQKDHFSFKTTSPVICVSYDYKLKKWFSLGASYSYQSFYAAFNNYTYKSFVSSDTVTESFGITFKRANFALRPIFYIPFDSEAHDLYAGARIGFTSWSLRSTAVHGYNFDKGFSSPLTMQGFIGYRYSIKGIAGLYAELAVGPTYFAMAGVNVKF